MERNDFSAQGMVGSMDMASASELFLDDRGQSMTRSGFEYILE